MIAQRFRPVGWVAGIAVAATGLYMISLHVASERGRLENIDRKILLAKRDIRQLQTELGTRASLRQLERWNGEVLSLSAPGAEQYLTGEGQLASVDRDAVGKTVSPAPAVMIAVGVKAQAEAETKAAVERPALLTAVAEVRPAQSPAIAKPVRDAKRPKSERVAMLDTSAISDMAYAASAEAGAKTRK